MQKRSRGFSTQKMVQLVAYSYDILVLTRNRKSLKEVSKLNKQSTTNKRKINRISRKDDQIEQKRIKKKT